MTEEETEIWNDGYQAGLCRALEKCVIELPKREPNEYGVVPMGPGEGAVKLGVELAIAQIQYQIRECLPQPESP